MLWWTVSQLKSKNAGARAGALHKLGDSEDPNFIPVIVPFLYDPEPTVRIAAAGALGHLGTEPAVRALCTAVKDTAGEVRLAVVKSLRSLRSSIAIPALVELLNDSNPEVAGYAGRALRQLDWEPTTAQEGAAWRIALGEFDAAVAYGSVAVEPLARLTRNAPFHLCIRAVEALARTGDPQAVKPLLECMKHNEDIVRSCAAAALGQVGDARAVEPLLRALLEPNKQIVLAACNSLSRLGDQRAVDPVIKLLTHQSSDVRAAALETLGKLRDPRAVPSVVKLLVDSDKEVREGAAFSLGLLRDERAIEPLVLALTDVEGSVRQAAIRALRLTDPYWERSDHALAAVPELQNRLKSREYWVRQSAAEALNKLGRAFPQATPLVTETDVALQKRKAAADILVSMLVDHDRDFRLAAADALGRMSMPQTIPALAEHLSDSDRNVQSAAARSLEALRWEPSSELERARYLVALEKWADAAALGPAAIDPLTDALSRGGSAARRRAVEALVQIGGPQAVSALITIAADPSEAVQADARAALAVLGHGSDAQRSAKRFAT